MPEWLPVEALPVACAPALLSVQGVLEAAEEVEPEIEAVEVGADEDELEPAFLSELPFCDAESLALPPLCEPESELVSELDCESE